VVSLHNTVGLHATPTGRDVTCGRADDTSCTGILWQKDNREDTNYRHKGENCFII
jgi:hypothetical protein